MSERYIDICNWNRFQHKDIWRKSGGRPPWIKAYTALLHDDGWLSLSESQRGILLGLWLMYASAGQSINEVTARRLLSTNKVASRHFLSNLAALNHAGFIEFVAQPIRAPVAPRVEEKRVDTLSKDVSSARGETAERDIHKRTTSRGNGWVDNLGAYTGCRYIRGEFALTAKYDPLGTEPPPNDWPHERPTRDEIRQALEELAVA